MTDPNDSRTDADEAGTPPHGDPLLAAAKGEPQGDGTRHGAGATGTTSATGDDAGGDVTPPDD